MNSKDITKLGMTNEEWHIIRAYIWEGEKKPGLMRAAWNLEALIRNFVPASPTPPPSPDDADATRDDDRQTTV